MSAPASTVAAAEPSSLRLTLTLGVAGLISGLLLVLVYQATLPTIEHNRAEALRAAIFRVVPHAARTQKLVSRDGSWHVAGPQDKGEGIYATYDPSHNFVGYAIVAEGSGFQDTIRLIFGFDPDQQRIVGMEVLESRETPGLGDKIYKDPHFAENFRSLAIAPPIVAVKGGRSRPNEIDAITGATISSKSVVKIVNAACARWVPLLKQPGARPAFGGGKER